MRIVHRGTDGFEDARVGRVFNHRRPDRQPVAVIEATTAEDVVAAVRLAKENGWPVSVRSGGHSWAAWSVRDDTLLLDLGGLTGMHLDEETGIVRVEPAARGGSDLDPYLAAHGRFFAGGHCPTVGVGGFLLQGGMGWNCRGWGWAAESIVALDVVTADGELVRADAEQNADLYWAARGSGPGFFGVVTAFYLQTRPRFTQLTQTTQVYPLEVAEDVLRWIHQIHRDIRPTVELVVVGIKAPLPAEVDHEGPVVVVHGVAFDDPDALDPLGTSPVLDRALIHVSKVPTTLDEERTEQVRANPEGHRWAVDNAWLTGTPDEVAPRLVKAFTTLPTEKAFSLWFDMAPTRPLPDMALSLQTDIYFASYVVWDDEADDERCRAWLDERMHDLAPVTAGCYLGDSDFTRRPAQFLSAQAYDRLERIRAERDPDGRFAGYLTTPGTVLNVDPSIS